MCITINGNLPAFTNGVGEIPSSMRIIEVFEKSDFGTFVGGKATLTPDVVYWIKDQIDLGTCTLIGTGTFYIQSAFSAPFAMTVTTNSADPLYEIVGSLSIFGIVSINSGAGSCFKHTARALPSRDFLNLFTCGFISVGAEMESIGATGMGAILFDGVATGLGSKGFKISGVQSQMILVDTNFLEMQSNIIFLEILAGTTFSSRVSIIDSSFNFAESGQINQTGLKIAASINPVAIGRIAGSSFVGSPATFIDGVTADNVFWRLEDNGPAIEDSTVIGKISFQGNATETVISIISTPVDIEGTYVLGSGAQRIELDVDGKSALVISKEPVNLELRLGILIDGPAINQVYVISLLQDGTLVAGESFTVTRLQAELRATASFIASAVEGTKFKFQIENMTSTQNVTVIDYSLTISLA